MKRKTLALAISIILTFALAGCGEIDDSSKAKRPDLEKALHGEVSENTSSVDEAPSRTDETLSSKEENSQEDNSVDDEDTDITGAREKIGDNGAKAVCEVYKQR